MTLIGQRKRVLVRRIFGLSLERRNLVRVYMPTHTATKWSGRTQESAHPRSSKGHVEQEAYAQVILGRSCKYCHLPHELVHNIWSAQCNPSREALSKEVGSIPCKDIRLSCIRAHSRRKAAKLRSQVREVYYPRRVLTRAKGVQMLQPFYSVGSCESGCSL